MRECVAFVAIYNVESVCKDSIVESNFLLDYGLLRHFTPRNDAVVAPWFARL
ncbi:hypothetical protein [Helicobacter rodentium]|uniref:hypothetical protein n=1 Tax=Helicobacter rodentium TaxID=59617 RepID=UPI002356E0C2|nr:hypothetical protein [Helicobacter rodentium]